ncbi:hypothetical protein GCM10011613_13200 [Cellvibrio zantedeschiae]|uniref:Uncharacterized protein n=1 Tax=Cellvibrio zantedeschiae TaxID=1237077 RepID=A0ABQ3B0H2_9GAMM|nr:polyribonucleotide nucleotidyltransferase [Cellvibrio zantedeschiae]GGY70152.1 hypothetical protein GCM10011613_13200 [Cellvibrio zantedeschiae]
MAVKTLSKAIVMSLSVVMVLELTACGTVFYPERKGTKSGSIDPIVAVADAVGLLFFFIPGIIAFAVDFSNGTIYLPHGKHSSLTPEELKSVSPNGKVDKKALSELVSKKVGLAVNLNSADLQVKAFSSEASLLTYLNANGLTLASL